MDDSLNDEEELFQADNQEYIEDEAVLEGAGDFAGGSGTAEDPYQISSYEQLKNIGKQTQDGLYYILTSDIEANSAAPARNSANIWTPVNPRNCYFDGNGKTIKNLSISGGNSEFAGMFSNESSVSILKDLNVENVHYAKGNVALEGAAIAIKANEVSGCKVSGQITVSAPMEALTGIVYDAEKVTDCVYDASFETKSGKEIYYISGIAYSATFVRNCTSTAEALINSAETWVYSSIAGIVFKIKENGIVENCTNKATLRDSFNVAGIVNSLPDSNAAHLGCKSCHNYGDITGSSASGIVSDTLGSSVAGCINDGKITSNCYPSGIVGNLGKYVRATNDTFAVAENCINNGEIRLVKALYNNAASNYEDEEIYYGADPVYATGIVNQIQNSGGIIRNCINNGNIITEDYNAAGIVGINLALDGVNNDALIQNCVNTGNITGYDGAAGIIYCVEQKVLVDRCYNSGYIKRIYVGSGEIPLNTAGIASRALGGTIQNSFNAGVIDVSASRNSTQLVAGIVNIDNNKVKINNCYNVGEIKPGKATAYGIVSQFFGECLISNCYYLKSGKMKGVGGSEYSKVSVSAKGLTASEMKTKTSFKGFDFNSVWQIGNNEHYPYPELISQPYVGPDFDSLPEEDQPIPVVEGTTYVVKQKFDITAADCLGKAYGKYIVSPAGSATISKGIVTIKKAPADGVITITGCEKNGKKWDKAKIYSLKVEKPVFVKAVKLKAPYYADINPDNENAFAVASSLMSNTSLTPSSWTSSKPAVADYDAETGRIVAKGKGSAKFTATFGDPTSKLCAKYSFTVTVNIPVISKKAATLQSGASSTLKLTGRPKKSVVVWTSSMPEYVSVNEQTGKVAAVKYNEETNGKVTISASIDGVSYPCYTCEVSVVRPELKKTTARIKKGKSVKIATKKTKLTVKSGNITFKSLDESIATVNEKGKVVGIAPGECVIVVSVAGVELPFNVNVY